MALRPFLVTLIALSASCASHRPPDAGEGGVDGGAADAGAGEPCASDDDCDDGVACTEDRCAVSRICMHVPDHRVCADDSFCDGAERCDAVRGCLEGSRETCNDSDLCTVDRCDEAGATCEHAPRDLDLDGDVDIACRGGGDCDDRDPTVSSLVTERCANDVDDDCDGTVDEAACGTAPHDTCGDPLDVSAGGTFVVDATALQEDYLGCGILACRDFVARFTLDDARDVEIVADAGDDFTYTEIALRTDCEDPASTLADVTGFPATFRRHSLGRGTYYLLVGGEATFGSSLEEIALQVRFSPPTEEAPNESCESALDVGTGGSFVADFVGAEHDLDLGCGSDDDDPELVYSITLGARSDLRVTLDGLARLGLSLRPQCDDAASALRCVVLEPYDDRELVFHDLDPGTYHLVLELQSIPETTAGIAIDVRPPTAAPAGDTCDEAIPLVLGVATPGSLGAMQDDVDGPGFCNDEREIVYAFDLAEASDVWAHAEGTRPVGITVRTSCDATSPSPGCNYGGDPARGSAAGVRGNGLAAGRYYATVEGGGTESFVLTVDAWPARTGASIPVTGNDRCEDAIVVPPAGGRFSGDTTPMADDYLAAACPASRARDVAFRLDLGARRRIVASTVGSSFATLLQLHRDACRSRAEVACDQTSGGSSPDLGARASSVIDRVLEPGTWYLVLEGQWEDARGAYELDVLVLDAP